MPYFFVPEITGFVHLHTFWEDFWQPKRSSNCEEKLWKLRIKVQPISKRGTLITEWKYLKLHLVVEPNLDLLTYSIWPWNLNHATLKRSGFSKIKTRNHCLGYPRKNPFKKEPLCRSLLGPSFCTDGFSHPWLCWNHCNLQHVSCHAGLSDAEHLHRGRWREIWKLSKAMKSLEKLRKFTILFQGNSQRSYTQLLDLALILVGTGEKQIHVDT